MMIIEVYENMFLCWQIQLKNCLNFSVIKSNSEGFLFCIVLVNIKGKSIGH